LAAITKFYPQKLIPIQSSILQSSNPLINLSDTFACSSPFTASVSSVYPIVVDLLNSTFTIIFL